ncbi:MAG: ankyrin repeat domain-containing protein [Candidatus Babeliaceae bacterium]
MNELWRQASFTNNLETFELLFARGFKVNKIINEEPAIYRAAWKGNYDAVQWLFQQWLFQHGANLNALNNISQSLLMLAQKEGHQDIANYLLAQGADTDIFKTKEQAEFQLLQAAAAGNLSTILEILTKDIPIDYNCTYSATGKTPLILAAQGGHAKIVHLLLQQKGIWIEKNDHLNQNAFDYAQQAGHYNIDHDMRIAFDIQKIKKRRKKAEKEGPIVIRSNTMFISICPGDEIGCIE